MWVRSARDVAYARLTLVAVAAVTLMNCRPRQLIVAGEHGGGAVVSVEPPRCPPTPAAASLVRGGTVESAAAGGRLVIRLLSADSAGPISDAMVRVGARRAMPMPQTGVYIADSLLAGRHAFQALRLGYLPLRESLTVYAGVVETLTVRLALWCA